ncbi:MAG: methyltransferase [Gammaproteobacteria bacterium]
MLILSSLTFILVLYTTQFCWRRYQIWAWQNQLQIKKHLTVLNRVSAAIDGFQLSRAARQNTDAYEYVYGEIDTQSFIALLSLIHPDSSTVFYDLGSGTGKTVLACAMVFDIKKACGVELFSTLNEAATQQLEQLKNIQNYECIDTKISFVCDDFLNVPLTEATVIYVAATGLFGDTWIDLNQRLEQLWQRPFIITTTKKLLSPQFQILHQTRVQMSWGIVDAYIQKFV